MIPIVGVFEERKAAENAVSDLRILGIKHRYVDLLRAGGPEAQLSGVPISDSEPRGMAEIIGTFLGSAVGLAGFSIGAAAAGALALGAGPVIALGSLGAAALGVAGAVGGHAAGVSVDQALTKGLPKDELFVYADALRQGRCVVICLAQTKSEAGEVRTIFTREGAETIDAAHHRWWLGLRDVVQEHYKPPGPNVDAPDDPFRHGFEAALSPEFRGKPWDQVQYLLVERYGDWSEDGFRWGFESGQRLQLDDPN